MGLFHRIARIALSLALMALMCAAPAGAASWLEKLFAPKAELWQRWTAHDESSTARIDHAPWQRFLAAYLSGHEDRINRLDYGAVTEADAKKLRDYLAGLARLPISRYGKDEQRAYWINLYNALTVATVLEHYPIDSVRKINISPGLLSFGPWNKKLITIEGEPVSLNDIEHRILRPIWRDARLHYALNCAALGCPNLVPKPFTAEATETMLEAAAREYVNHPRGASLGAGGLEVSSIYLWFQEDFGGDDAGVIAHLARYARPELEAPLGAIDEIADSDYDWRLNDK